MNMKFIAACATVVAGMAMTACGSGDKAQCDAATDTTVSKSCSDSISEVYGLMVGSMINGELRYYAQHEDHSYDSREFVKGMQSVLGEKQDPAYMAGVNAAMRISADLNQLEEQGVSIDRKKIMENLRKTILADSISEDKGNQYAAQYRELLNQVQTKAEAREQARKNMSPEAVQNARTGAAFIDKTIKNDANVNAVKGVGLRIDRAGVGSVAKTGDRAIINFSVAKPDGTIVMQNDSAMVAVTPGDMPEAMFIALTSVAKGGKATVYAPGEKAFGVNGIPQSNIGPNEAMVFNVEVLDITPSK